MMWMSKKSVTLNSQMGFQLWKTWMMMMMTTTTTTTTTVMFED
jgi:hypothetical protein